MAYGVRICSFIESHGEAVVRGKLWRWEFSRHFGPVFLGKDGDPLKNQPGERHPVWDAFETWRARQKRDRHE